MPPSPPSTAGVSRYARLAQQWRQRIGSGQWAAGGAIPAESELARSAGVALGTVRQALALLVAEGLLERVHGRGTFVTRGLGEASMLRFFRFEPAAAPPPGDPPGGADQQPALAPRSRILERRVEQASAEQARRLGLPADAKVLRVRRLRLIDDRPVLAETLRLPLPLFEPLAHGRTDDWDDLLYPMYSRRCGVTVVRATDELSFGTLDAEQALSLALSPGAPCVRVERAAFDLADRCIELRTTLGSALDFHYRAEIR